MSRFEEQLITCNHFSNGVYEVYMKVCREGLKDLTTIDRVLELNLEKTLILINLNMVSMTENNFTLLKENYKEAHLFLIEKNATSFVAWYPEVFKELVDEIELLYFFNSKAILDKIKIDLLCLSGVIVGIGSRNRDVILELLNTTTENILRIRPITFIYLFRNREYNNENKLELLLKYNIKNFNLSQLRKVFSHMNGDFSKLLTLKRPKLKYTKLNWTLVTKLQDKFNCFSTLDKNKDGVIEIIHKTSVIKRIEVL